MPLLSSFPVAALAGVILGILAGLGVGGGTILIIWLTAVLGMDGETARTINLLFFLCSSGAASFYRLRHAQLKLRPLIPAIAAGCTAAAIGCLLSRQMDTELARKLFGILLLTAGVREIFYREREFK